MVNRLQEGEFKLPAGEDDGEEIGFMPARDPAADEDDGKKKGKKGAKGKAAKPVKRPKEKKPRSLVLTLLFLVFGGSLSASCMYLALLKFIGKDADVLGIASLLPESLAPPGFKPKKLPSFPPFNPPGDLAQANAPPAADPPEPAANAGQAPEAMPADNNAPVADGKPPADGKPAAEAAPEPSDPGAADLGGVMAPPDKPNVGSGNDSLDDLLAPPKKTVKSKPAAPAAEDDPLGAKPAEDDGFGAPPKKKPPAAEMPADDPLAEKPAPAADPLAPTPNAADDLLAPEKPAKSMKPPAEDPLPGFEEKPAADKPAAPEPEMEAPPAKAPKAGKGAADDLGNDLDPLADKPAKTAKPDPAMPDDLLAPEPKAPAKPPADDPLMVDEKPAPAKSVEPAEEPAAPIVPINAATYAAADVGSALQAAEDSDAVMSAPDAIPADELKKTKAAYFRSLYKLGEVLTNAADDPAEPYLNKDKAAALNLLKKIAGDPAKLGEISNAAGKWLKYPKRGEHSGIVLSGVVGAVAQQGKLFEVSVTIPGQEDPISVFTAKRPRVAEGDQVLVLGSVIDDPTSNLPDYTGKQANVIWNGLTLKLPVGESG